MWCGWLHAAIVARARPRQLVVRERVRASPWENTEPRAVGRDLADRPQLAPEIFLLHVRSMDTPEAVPEPIPAIEDESDAALQWWIAVEARITQIDCDVWPRIRERADAARAELARRDAERAAAEHARWVAERGNFPAPAGV